MEQPTEILAVADARRAETRRAMWQWVGGMVGFVVAAAVIGGILFKVPYVALVPGAARDTEPLLVVDGVDSYPSDGELLLTTVRVRQRPNLWEYLWLQADRDVDIVPEEVVLGDRTPEENRELNLQLMTDSKSVAVAVALEELGYDAISSDGVRVIEVVEASAADGLLDPGDTITAIGDDTLSTTTDLIDVLSGYEPGDVVELTVERFDAETGEMGPPTSVAVELGDHPDRPGDAFLGVGPIDRVELTTDFDFVVDIDSGSVGGPSAGLAFTLAVLDQLTPGELTGGSVVAVTGTIDVAGTVGTVGGVVQKTAAVRDLGADVFIVPAALGEAQLERIEERAGDDLRVIPVDDLDEALDALAELGGEVDAVEEFAAANLDGQRQPATG